MSHASEALRQLIALLWPAEGAVVGTGAPPAGHRVVEGYAVVPSPERARFLVPLAGRTAAAATLTAYNGLRWARLRVPRTLIGAGYLTGVAPALLRHRLVVSVPDDVPDRQLPDRLLLPHLRQVLRRDDLATGVGVRRPDPNFKPTLQLFTAAGRPAAFTKVGWNDATRALVTREAETITELTRRGTDTFRVPALLHHGGWRDYLLTATEPLPTRIRRHRDADAPPPASVTLDVAGPHTRTAPLAESRYWQAIRGQLAGLRTDPRERALARALIRAVDSIEVRHGDRDVRLGRWHGDWVPWNLGHHRGALHVWDWEHSAADVPVGFDLLHWRFQVALVLRGWPLRHAVAEVRRAAPGDLGRLGVPAGDAALLSRLYLIEMFLRGYRLRRDGTAWNPALYPGMIDIVESWRSDGE